MDMSKNRSRSGMSRREFLAAAGIGAASLAINPSAAFASSSSVSSVNTASAMEPLSESDAILFAKNFYQSISGRESIGFSASNCTTVFSSSGRGLGYSIDFVNPSNQPIGYVVIDADSPNSIAEFSYEQGAVSPISAVRQSTPSVFDLNDQERFVCIKSDEMTYSLFDVGEKSFLPVPGRTFENQNGIAPMSADPESWNDVMIYFDDVYRNWNVVNDNSVGGIKLFTESEIERVTGRYACGVTAAYTVCTFYRTTSMQSTGLKEGYYALWNRANVETYDNPNGAPGVIYGSTYTINEANAVVGLSATAGVSLSFDYRSTVSYSDYVSCIDSWNVGLFGGAINGVNGGHAVAVFGYMGLQDKSNPLNGINALWIHDGWTSMPRGMNFTTSYYAMRNGALFKKN